MTVKSQNLLIIPDDRRLVHFTLETSALSEIPPISSMQIRRVTVISNTLNAIRSVYSLQNSPLLKLLLDPLSGHAAAINTAEIVYKGYVSNVTQLNKQFCMNFYIISSHSSRRLKIFSILRSEKFILRKFSAHFCSFLTNHSNFFLGQTIG